MRARKKIEGFQCYTCKKVFKNPIDFYKGERICVPCRSDVDEIVEFMNRVPIKTGTKGKVLISCMPGEFERAQQAKSASQKPHEH